MLINIIILIASLALIIYAAGKLVEGGSALAARFNIPGIIIGLTIVAFGTSSPELIVSTMSAYDGQSALALGNVLGSNIVNVLLILGITALICPIPIQKNTTRFEVPIMTLAGLCLLLMFYFSGDGNIHLIDRLDAVILLVIFAGFVGYTIYMGKHGTASNDVEIKEMPLWKSIFWIIFGLAGLIVGGDFLVDAATEIALQMAIPQRIIAVTIVAIGTSLPEFATSIVAALKKQTDMAIGNVVGSNIFNIFFILGTSAAISPIEIASESIYDILINLGTSMLLFLFIFTGRGRKIERVEGGIFTALYIAYIVLLITGIL